MENTIMNLDENSIDRAQIHTHFEITWCIIQ